jgi:amino acid transporter
VTSWTFYLLTVLGLMYLRIKEPHLPRPYRTYMITPVTFCVVCPSSQASRVIKKTARLMRQVASFLLLMPIFAAPLEAVAALGELDQARWRSSS